PQRNGSQGAIAGSCPLRPWVYGEVDSRTGLTGRGPPSGVSPQGLAPTGLVIGASPKLAPVVRWPARFSMGQQPVAGLSLSSTMETKRSRRLRWLPLHRLNGRH